MHHRHSHHLSPLPISLLSLLILFLAPIAAFAGFVTVEDFESLVLGPIDDQEGWYAEHASSAVVLDPEGDDNQVLSITTESTHLHREMLLLDGTVRMFFLRFRYASHLNVSFGLSDVVNPSQFDHFESELSLTNATAELRINDDGHYKILAVLEPEVWYNCWLLVDAESDECQVWLHDRDGENANFGDKLSAEGQEVFEFRKGGANDLIRFYVKTGGGNGVAGPLYLDDFFLEDTDALNLWNPAGASTAAPDAVAAFAGLGQPYPNPFNPRTTLPLRLDREARVELRILDLSGRRVRVIEAGLLGAGRHAIVWDGRDDAGEGLPSGVYHQRLLIDGVAAGSRKAVLLK